MANKSVVLEDTVSFELLAGYKDEDGNIHKTVEMRDITGIDEEAIAKPDVRNNFGRTITVLLANTTVRLGDIDFKKIGKAKAENIIKNLSMGDRDLMLLKLYQFTKSEEIELDMKCPSCRQKIVHIVDIENDIEIKDISVDIENIPFELPKGVINKDGERCNTGKMRMPNGQDQELLDAVARKNEGQANTSLLSRVITEIDGTDVSQALVRKMATKDREYLLKVLTDSRFGPNYVIEFSCPSCGEDIERGVHPLNFI